MILATSLQAAGFANLDFEEADPSLLETDQGMFGTTGSTESRIPHWSFWIGNIQQFTIGNNSATIGALQTSLHDRRSFGPDFNRYPPPPFEGSFGFIFNSQVSSNDFLPSLQQSGTIPTESKMIQILVFGDPIKVYLNGQLIPLTYQLNKEIEPTPPYLPLTIAYGDISNFAGKQATLRIEPDSNNAVRTFSGIDKVQFTNELLVFSDSVLVDEGDPIVLRRLK